LSSFKSYIKEVCQEVYETFMAEKDNDTPGKGNFTWFNFDRSIKIEVSINEQITFDDLTIKAAQDKLNEFLGNELSTTQEFIKELIKDAFSTSRGKLDSKKVMSLVRHKNRISDPIFQEAIALVEQSIRRPESKTYFRIWQKNEDGKYEVVDLNFSSI
jgi:predicted Zn-dependent protease